MPYIYRDHHYNSLDEAHEAVAEYVGSNYNNIDPYTTLEFEEECEEIEECSDVATRIVRNYIESREVK